MTPGGHSEQRDNGSIRLKEYIEAKIEAIETARQISCASLDKRLESMNEFRNALKDQAAQMLTRTEFNISHRRIEDDIRLLLDFKSNMDGKASQLTATIGIIFGIVGILLSLGALISVILLK